jgi:pilus assembly protein CpaB
VRQRRGWIAIFFGILFAIGAGALVFVILLQQQSTAAEQARQIALEQARPMAMLRVPVAARPLQPGLEITASDYVLQEFPLNLIPPQAITNTVQIDGKLVVQAIGQGETFSTRMFLGGEGATVSEQIEPGRLLFAFPATDLMSQANVIQEGDRLDLLVTISASGDPQLLGGSTAMTLQNIPVVKIIRPVPDPLAGSQDLRPTALLLSVSPQEAVILKYVKDSGGIIDFALRSTLDREESQSDSFSGDDLTQRYFPR